MRRNKKAFLALLITTIAVFAIGTVSVTYAWFLSRYSMEYGFELDSESSSVVIKYEAGLVFATGDESTPSNALVPATAQKTVGIEQDALSPLDMFDEDVAATEHTGAVKTAAHAVAFTSEGAYWTGARTDVAYFTPELHAYLSTYAPVQAWQNTTPQLSVLETATHTAHDLVAQGEVDFVMVIAYRGEQILYCEGDYYVFDDTEAAANVPYLPAEIASTYWHKIGQNDTYGDTADKYLENGALCLDPNTTFTVTWYVFMAKTDEELDPAINGETLAL